MMGLPVPKSLRNRDTVVFGFFVSWLTVWPAAIAFVVAGIVMLKYGADGLVSGASNLGLRFGMSATLTGLTIVAFGTSAPELVISVLTALRGQGDICLGNVIGSNIANTGFILGGTAVVVPLAVSYTSIRFELLLAFASMLAVWFLCAMGETFSRWDGMILLVIFIVWMSSLIRLALRKSHVTSSLFEQTAGETQVSFAPRAVWIDLMLLLAGLAGLVFGAQALVDGAVAIARELSVPDVVVGLTVVAGGTSLPEFAVCLVAALRRQSDIVFGNVLGSNIFNALLILGVAGVIAPIPFGGSGVLDAELRQILWIDIPICAVLCGLLVPLIGRRRRFGRVKGLFLWGTYVVYVVSLILRHA